MRQVVKELPQAVEDKSAEEHQRADQSIEGPTRDTAVSDHDLCVRHFKGRTPVKHLGQGRAQSGRDRGNGCGTPCDAPFPLLIVSSDT